MITYEEIFPGDVLVYASGSKLQYIFVLSKTDSEISTLHVYFRLTLTRVVVEEWRHPAPKHNDEPFDPLTDWVIHRPRQ